MMMMCILTQRSCIHRHRFVCLSFLQFHIATIPIINLLSHCKETVLENLGDNNHNTVLLPCGILGRARLRCVILALVDNQPGVIPL